MTEGLLGVDTLETGYSEPVVGPISFRIDRGEVIGLVGPNGSGKSTVLKAIANGAHIFKGRVTRKAGLTLAWMEQQPVKLDQMPFSGWEYLRFAVAERHAPPQHLARWLDRRVDSLSGGQFQLLRGWAALGGDAELILLDEPTNNLDEDSAEVLRETLSRHRADRGVLVVSHDRSFLENVCARVLEVRT